MLIPLAAAMVVFSVEFFAEVCVLEVLDAFSALKTVVLVSCAADVRAVVRVDMLVDAVIGDTPVIGIRVFADAGATALAATVAALKSISALTPLDKPLSFG